MKINREWAMPNKETFKIKPIGELITRIVSEQYISINSPLVIVDAFSGNVNNLTLILQEKWVRRLWANDINPDIPYLNNHIDGLVFLKQQAIESIDIAIFDPPYSPRQVSECYKKHGYNVTQKDTQARFWSDCKKEIARIVRPNGKAICCGWNSQGIGNTRGFELTEILLVAHGGNHNDTIVTVERKL